VGDERAATRLFSWDARKHPAAQVPSNKLLDSISEEEAEKETAFLDRLQKHLENFSVSNNDES